METFGSADNWVMDQLPQASIKELAPQMPPDIFADYNSIGALFVEASGLTETLQGKGTKDVRSKGHAQQMLTTGSGRIKKTATKLEAPLVRMGDLALKLNQRNNDQPIIPDPKDDGKPGDAFLYANLASDYSLTVAGHSHSPLFSDDSKDMATLLMKAQAIDKEGFIRLMNPPGRNNLIHSLRDREKKAAQAAAKKEQMGIPPDGQKPRKNGHAHP